MYLKWFVCASAMIFLLGCGSAPGIAEKPEALDLAESETYRIGVGDQLTVGVWKNAELSVAVPVRPDGKISVPLAGDVLAAGRSTDELSEEISSVLGQYIRSPKVTVIVTNPVSADFLRRVRIVGAVNAPQSIGHRQGMTVLDLVLQAGGVTPFAAANKTKLYRKVSSKVKVYPVYLKDILEKGDLESNFTLMPSDVITVPERVF